MINGWPTFAKASAISGYHIDSFRRWYRAGFCNPLRKELRIKEGIAVGANDLFYELPCVHPHDVEDLRRVKAGKEPALRGSSPTKATEPPAPEEASEPQRNGCTAPDVAPPTIADVPPEQFKEAPAPPENGRGGRPTKRERDKYIRRLAKSAGLTRDPAELSRRLNADSAFVERWGTVTKGTVKGVFRRWNGRAQNH